MKESALPDIVARTADAATSFARFQRIQTDSGVGAADTRSAKRGLRLRMNDLRDELDRHLASDYGISLDEAGRFDEWRSNHQPFHWCAEFYEVVEEQGGFDVVIGNPPYIGMRDVRKQYALASSFSTGPCPDVYAPVVERSISVMCPAGRMGMIVPISLTCGRDFASLREHLHSFCAPTWFSSFDRRPSKLFTVDGESIRSTIVLAQRSVSPSDENSRGPSYTTRLHRWFGPWPHDRDRGGGDERPTLFPLLTYSAYVPALWSAFVPKIGSQAVLQAMERLLRRDYRLQRELTTRPSLPSDDLHFTKIGYNWVTFCVDRLPVMHRDGRIMTQATTSKYGTLRFADSEGRDLAMVMLNGKLLYLWWVAVSDGFNVTQSNFKVAPIGPGKLTHERYRRNIVATLPLLREAMNQNVKYTPTSNKVVGTYRLALCRDVTDRSDKILLEALGLAHLWDDIALEYSLLVRTEFVADGVQ